LHEHWIFISYTILVTKGEQKGKGEYRNTTNTKKSFQTFFLNYQHFLSAKSFWGPDPGGRSSFEKMKLCWFPGCRGQKLRYSCKCS